MTPKFISTVPSKNISYPDSTVDRLAAVMAATGAVMVYSDYYDETGSLVRLRQISEASFREDFDCGKAVMVDDDVFKEIRRDILLDGDELPLDWYNIRLRLAEKGRILHLPEGLYTYYANTGDDGGDDAAMEEQFKYLDPKNRDAQLAHEQMFTECLKRRNLFIPQSQLRKVDVSEGKFPVEASVVIPVRNRVRTVEDAVRSALSQETDFPFNVIAVDNRSTDGTLEKLKAVAAEDPRLVVVDLSEEKGNFGIGGCWNKALFHPQMGRFAVQLDSDDIYSSPATLQKVVDKFYSEACAMVIGSYRLTDFHGNTIPPGIIDHREWTPENGHNNILRVNGAGAPRAFFTPVARLNPFPDVSYGEDYAMVLALSRQYTVGRIFDPIYDCRRWEGNSDHKLSPEQTLRNDAYKDLLREIEVNARSRMNLCSSDFRVRLLN